MIQQTTFLGVSLRTRRNRRLVVAGYYLSMLALTLLPLLFGVTPMTLLAYVPQAVMMGGLLGGVMYGGVVKPYSTAIMLNRDPASANPITLHLGGGDKAFRTTQLLDERERNERDHAHFLAYRILLGILAALMIALWAVAGISAPAAQRSVPVLVWLLIVIAFSLPQTVILWTEPDPHPEGTLALV